VIVTALEDIQPGQVVIVDLTANRAWPADSQAPRNGDRYILARAAEGIRILKGDVGSVQPLAIDASGQPVAAPPRCPNCRRDGTAHAHHKVKGGRPAVAWRCHACTYQWRLTMSR
jgi:hypothetical protein